MRYLTVDEILTLHHAILEQSGGAPGLRDRNALEAAMSQPFQTFDGDDLYPSLIEKGAVLCFTLISNHPFVDGNKRVGHAALEVLLVLNGYELSASVDEQEEIILAVAEGRVSREQFVSWVREHVVKREKA